MYEEIFNLKNEIIDLKKENEHLRRKYDGLYKDWSYEARSKLGLYEQIHHLQVRIDELENALKEAKNEHRPD